MGEFTKQLLEVNGETGHSYRLRLRNEMPFGMDTLNETRYYAEQRGHVAVLGAIEASADGGTGLIKLVPELSVDERHGLFDDLGVSAEPLLH